MFFDSSVGNIEILITRYKACKTSLLFGSFPSQMQKTVLDLKKMTKIYFAAYQEIQSCTAVQGSFAISKFTFYTTHKITTKGFK